MAAPITTAHWAGVSRSQRGNPLEWTVHVATSVALFASISISSITSPDRLSARRTRRSRSTWRSSTTRWCWGRRRRSRDRGTVEVAPGPAGDDLLDGRGAADLDARVRVLVAVQDHAHTPGLQGGPETVPLLRQGVERVAAVEPQREGGLMVHGDPVGGARLGQGRGGPVALQRVNHAGGGVEAQHQHGPEPQLEAQALAVGRRGVAAGTISRHSSSPRGLSRSWFPGTA